MKSTVLRILIPVPYKYVGVVCVSDETRSAAFQRLFQSCKPVGTSDIRTRDRGAIARMSQQEEVAGNHADDKQRCGVSPID